ncbi:tyrosine-type recombinase/integrase [Aureliella helgolandensis]|uniref:Tyrosine recombinase XerC n=1 Tax=Aureliella helgolandensis TaxID=2527968 RepID=A0A518G2T5_9BACT|nr:tyrosine-type recombinase/integrase [Aureliella helgolandensis]QDV22865.1 Tyrosine recombinase XerC [Aureliella helgolandensis]
MGTVYRRTKGGKYHGEYTNAHGKRVRRTTGTTRKQDAERIVAQWESDAAAARHGVAISQDVTLAELVDEYLDYLGNSGAKHLTMTRSRVTRILTEAGWTKPAHMNQFELEKTVRRLKDEKTGKPLALRTQGHYITAAKSFSRWLTILRNVLHRDPLAGTKKPNFSADRRLSRRFLLPTEWRWLSQTPNALLYETAIQTGFRAAEIMHLKPEHLADDHIYLPAVHTKNKQPAKQYVTADLLTKLAGQLPFIVNDSQRLAKLLRADLAIARSAYIDSLPRDTAPDPVFLMPEDARGNVLDFHSLRHTCGAWLAIRNVNPKVIQSVMRHSTITLTLDTYGHLLPGAERDVVAHFEHMLTECQ